MSVNANGLAVGITALILFSFAIAVAIITAISRRRLIREGDDVHSNEETATDTRHHRKRSILTLTSSFDFSRKNADLPPPPVPPKPKADSAICPNEEVPKRLPVFGTRKSLSLSKPLPSGLSLTKASKASPSSTSLPGTSKSPAISFTITSPSHRSMTSTLHSMPSVESVLDQYEKEVDKAAEGENEDKWSGDRQPIENEN